MRSTTYTTLDLQKPNFVTVYAVQDDQMTRWVHADLMDGGEAWTPPSGTLMTIRYRKPDGTGGWYDSLEDGSSAYAISGSAVDFGFAAQCLTVAGVVLAEITFWTGTAERLSAFLFRLQVEKNPLTDAEMESSDYYNVLSEKIAAVLGATTHPPQIDPTSKNWLLWDETVGGYADSGFSSVGTTGPAPQITSQVRTWQGSSSGTTIPSGSWSSTIPEAVPGQYLWSRTILTYNNGQDVTLYAVAYQGNDGEGAPGSQLPLMDGAASAGSANAYSRQDHVHPTQVSRNLLIYPFSTETRTVNGITFTDNGDGTITANGTASANATFLLRGWTIADGSVPIDPRITYRLTGSPDGATASTYFVACRYFAASQTPSSTGGTLTRDYGEGATFTGAAYVSVYLAVMRGTTVSNLTFNPMLTYADITDAAFSMYGKESLVPDIVDAVETLQDRSPFAKTVTFSAAGSTSLTDPRFTADHRLVGYQFFDSSNNVSEKTLADMTITTAEGSCAVTIDTVYNAGSVVLTFAYAPASN